MYCESHLYWVGQKFLWLLSRTKRHIFHFHQVFYCAKYSFFFPLPFDIFQATSQFHLSQIFISEQKTVWGVSYNLPVNWNFFPLREFCKDWNKCTSGGAMSGEYGRWTRTSHSNCLSFCLIVKEICSLVLTWWKWEGNRQED